MCRSPASHINALSSNYLFANGDADLEGSPYGFISVLCRKLPESMFNCSSRCSPTGLDGEQATNALIQKPKHSCGFSFKRNDIPHRGRSQSRRPRGTRPNYNSTKTPSPISDFARKDPA